MDFRRLLFLGIAVILAGAIAMSVRSAAKPDTGERPIVQNKDLPAILVAKIDLPAGSLIQPDQLAWQTWPTEKLGSMYIQKGSRNLDEFAGAVVRSGLRAGEPITDGRLVTPKDRGFMAAVLNPGMRAVSVRVDDASGVSGLVFPGDRVDVILTQTIAQADEGRRSTTRRASETVLTNVRVLAVDQRTDDIKTEAKIAKTTTLEVTPKQAEKIALIADLGKLSLSLRSLGAEPSAAADATTLPPDAPSYTWDSEASYLLSPVQKPVNLSIVRGNTVEDIVFKGGGS